MRIESLEQRALLSVSLIAKTFKDVDFTATGAVGGTFTVNVQGQPVQINTSGIGTLAGKIHYNSYDLGEILLDTISAQGPWKGGNNSGSWAIGGHANYPTNQIMDENGQLIGSVVIDQSYVNPGGVDLLNGQYDVGGTKSFFNTKDFSIGMEITNSDGSLTFKKSKFTPTETKAFDVVATTLIGDGKILVEVQVPGKVHKTADRSTPVTNIELYWAKGPSFLNRVGGALADKFPVYWNEAHAYYEVTDLPPAPDGATHLLFVAKFDRATKVVGSLALPTVSVAPTSVVEGDGDPREQNHAAFTVSLSHESPLPVTVWFTTVKGAGSNAAKPGSDYQTTIGSIVIPAGATQGEIKVPIIDDTTFEPPEKFWVKLIKSKNAAGLDKAHAKALGTILNDDDKPSISINDVAIAEGNSGMLKWTKLVFTVTLSNPSYQPVTVSYETEEDTASSFPITQDYIPIGELGYPFTPGTLKFAPGITTRSIAVTVVGDKRVELDEWFYVKLEAPTNATILDGEGVGTILNDDGAGAQNAAASRHAALSELAGPGQLAAYFERLGRKKSSDRATDLILATQ